ncbi:MAG TPA: hypothetical protein VHR66_02220 [Gemmataceae bacterium]|nr:hypothetical protein [Gemmataceae bacterium]
MPLRTHGLSRAARRRLTLACLLAVLTGCTPAEQVSKYTAPKDPIDFDSISDEPGKDEPPVRIVGAIVPSGAPGEDAWFVCKFQAPRMEETYSPRAIERHMADFDAFIRSLKFNKDGPPSWTVPKGWREVSVATQFKRIATFRMKKSETAVDLAVTANTGKLLDNINRWRELQAGIEPITEAEIDTKCKVLTVDGRKVVIVDVSGPGSKPGMMPPFPK